MAPRVNVPSQMPIGTPSRAQTATPTSTANRHTVTPLDSARTRPMRVYEVAQRLGRTSPDVLDALRSLGHFYRSAASVLPSGLDMPGLVAALDSLPPSRPATPTPPAPRGARRAPQDVTSRAAGELLRLSPSVIRQWVARGYLVPVGKQGNANLFKLEDVRTVRNEAAARTRRTAGDAAASPTAAGWELRDAEPWRRIPAKYYDLVVTGPRAAALVGVSPSTIRMWVARGHLKPQTPGARPLFRVRDVLTARRRKTRRAKH